MSITVAWDNEQKSLIRFTFGRLWTWNEFYAAIDQCRLQNTVDHPVDILFDARATNIIPGGLMPRIQRVTASDGVSHGLVVVVSESAFVKSMFILATRTFPNTTRNARFVKTLDEAYTLINRERRNVPLL